jgi:nitrite reductase/ring-hydroxylating ferredoxin subunit
MVDRERLKYLTRKAFVETKRRLVQDRVLKWQTRLVSHDGTVYVTPHVPDATFSADNLLGLPSVNWMAKAAAAMIRVTDGWTLEMTPEQDRLFREDRAYRAVFNVICRHLGMAAAASAGFGTLMETVICELHSRDFAYCISQTCRRVVPRRMAKMYGWPDCVVPGLFMAPPANGCLPPHKVRICGKPTFRSTDDGWHVDSRRFPLYEGPSRY